VAEDNPVRAVDVFVDGLDLDKLGFPRRAGRPPVGGPSPRRAPASVRADRPVASGGVR
jgi:hypothetical protein